MGPDSENYLCFLPHQLWSKDSDVALHAVTYITSNALEGMSAMELLVASCNWDEVACVWEGGLQSKPMLRTQWVRVTHSRLGISS